MVAYYSGRSRRRARGRRKVPVSAGGNVKTPAAVQLLLPEVGGITGFYEARTDRVLCVRCAGIASSAGTPIPEADCGDLHLQPLPVTAAGDRLAGLRAFRRRLGGLRAGCASGSRTRTGAPAPPAARSWTRARGGD